MSKTHHLTYVKTGRSTFEKPQGDDLKKQLSQLEGLKFGDVLKLNDGTTFGHYLEHLSDMDSCITEEHCLALLSDWKPRLACLNPHRKGHMDYKTFAYADRTVVTADGKTHYQILVKNFDELNWVNVSPECKVYLKEDVKHLQ
ncbi:MULTISPECIES: hypothetical protein [Vibrio]|uniref:Uncharacterized protein n=1 Tax=Vibrio vulnificus TaxID=672 RepID=A0AAN1PUI5_VIBVL|nr:MULTISPECIES: hypothetical protein [Vibrio]AXX62990.1 hypothetical protein FORC53_4651 [Vibrio vulnificus]EGR2217424.1 hypothetical protein [Vibrio parahaemolyticus]EGR5855736.1 hypothetical protein [Vibrio parahaemolyticus]ELA8201086.1 hypothetical protein [Vibrio parahaemolyticus]MCI4896043.1 hypothetical protein [Vibrio parahaemolyticus]